MSVKNYILGYHEFMQIKLFFRLMVIITSSLLLASCASLPTQPQPPQNQSLSWENRVSTLSGIQNWDLKGLIALRTAKNAWSANWQWQQVKHTYMISLFGPLGSNSFRLTGNPQNVLLETADGKKITAAHPESLLTEQLGWQLPVSYLHYWIRGLPVPNLAARKQFDAYHHLTLLMQQGWTIRYLNYVSVGHTDLPSKIFLANRALQVKIIISQWKF
ncbi:MAG: hypothetical protein ACD_45C00115G0002 [uncultured bacterium]|nr:MAG: hypothetical protein ACD_45C00115G0002 [uncultured bacterium]